MLDLMKVATIQAHWNRVETERRLTAHISVDHVTFGIHDSKDGRKCRFWHVVPACDIDKTIVEILQELNSDL